MATLTELAAEIVSSHASATAMSTDELLLEIRKVYEMLKQLESGAAEAVAEEEEKKPALTVKQAFKPNEVICMICGKGGMKTLTRHLSQAHNMKPGEYKKQFGIPSKQPLAAKKFSEERRKMAMERGMADLLAKAREKRAANIRAKKEAPAKKSAKKPARKAAPAA
jgi:predicted transcriptional regulator